MATKTTGMSPPEVKHFRRSVKGQGNKIRLKKKQLRRNLNKGIQNA